MTSTRTESNKNKRELANLRESFFHTRGAWIMRLSEDDHDIGTILLTVIVTVVLGAMVYAYNSWGNLQTAYMPAIERTVPTIVPCQPEQ